ncbi:MAG: hypothetical protein IPL12_22435 [Bacteroidetes bacterium]|nr:hypothetical protein [Bacteroidota bacterium]
MRYFISLINHIMYFRFTLTICILFCLAFNKPEVKEQFFENGKLKASATIDHGMFNGTYTSWYSNGIKKAEGNFPIISVMENGQFGIHQAMFVLSAITVTHSHL